MPQINRLTLPQNFTDQVSRKMLRAAVPEFFWNKYLDLASVQFNIEALKGSDLALAPDRAPSDGGEAPAPLDTLQLMLNDRSGQSGGILVSDDVMAAPGVGQTVRFLRPVFAGGGYTLALRRTSSGQQISTTPINISTESAYLTCERLNGPYDTVNSRVAPYAIDRRDSKRAIFSLVKLAAQALKYDRAAFVDAVFNALVDAIVASTISSASNWVIPGRGRKTTKAQMAGPGDSEMDLETVLRAIRTLAVRNVPKLSNGKYMCVLRPEAAAQLKLDNDFRELAKLGQSDQSKNPLFSSFVGDIGSAMIFESNTLTQDTSTVANNTINQGIMFGAEIFGYGVGEDVNIADSTVDNFGNQSLFIWQSEEAFGVLNNSFGVGLLSD
jgi:hypothetical protein